jgi:uncharacterized membrane protein
MLKNLGKIFLTGLATLFPIIVTAYFFIWLAGGAEKVLGNIIRFLIPDVLYLPGMGVVAGVIMVFAVGVMMKTWIAQRILEKLEAIVNRIPLIKTIYGALRDFADFFSKSGHSAETFDKMVMVPVGEGGMEIMGFITRENLDGQEYNIAEKDHVTVYLPMSYQIGGFTVVLHRSKLRSIDMPIDQGMKFIMTAGMAGKKGWAVKE